MSDTVFNNTPVTKYVEKAISCDKDEFKKVVNSRRSVRLFTDEVIPDEVVEECLDLALLAPNSSNLQPWEFYWVKSTEKMFKLKQFCFNQSAAKTAPTLVVCVARPDRWKLGQKLNLDFFAENKETPDTVLSYYKKLVPFAYNNGPLNIFAPLKKLLVTCLGLFRIVPRGPFGTAGNRLWATKTTALACQNLMLAFRSYGYDTCPMEGFDEIRVKRLLNLPREASVVMVISAGKRAEHGVYGERFRGPKNLFVKKV
ncbi:MAG: nitroreductase family protein [Pseudobdellovibrionaceae bacterium]